MPSRNHPWGKIHGDRVRFTPIMDDVLACLFHIQANALERRLLGYVLHWSWGSVAKKGKKDGRFRDAQPCCLDVPALAKTWGVSRTHLAEARASLLADRVLIPLGEGFTFNKDADDWDADRISPESIDFARSVADSRPVGEGNGRTLTVRRKGQSKGSTVRRKGQSKGSTVRRKGQSKGSTVRNPAKFLPETGQSPVPLSAIRQESCPKPDSRSGALYRNAGASEDLEIKEDKQERGGEASLSPVKDPIPAEPLPPNLAAAPPSPAEDEDRRLARWVFEKVLASTGDRGEAIDFGKAVAYWRSVEHSHQLIAGVVAEFLAFKVRHVEPANHLAYLKARIERRKPGEALPAVPSEWKPKPAPRPADARTPEMKARAREKHIQRIKDLAESSRRARESMGMAS